MLIFKILGFLLVVPGVAMVFMARYLVDKLSLSEKSNVDFEHEMTAEEIERYKENKATLNLKMLGMLVALPGFVMILIAFK